MAEANWYWADGDQQTGPVTGSAIARLVADGKLRADDMIWKQGMTDWVEVRKVPALVKYLKQSTPAVAAAPVAAEQYADVSPAPVIPYQQAPVDHREVHQYIPDPSGRAACPHCGSGNSTDAQYCEACGMAMPIPNSGPRIVDGTSFASTSAGQQLQSEELHKQAKRAAGALLAVAVIQTVFAVIIFGAVASSPRAVPVMQNFPLMILVVIAAIFWGLYVWARQQPLPAAIVGLVLYVTLKVLDVVAAVSQGTIGNTSGVNGIGGTGISWLTFVIIAVLAQAISAGLKYRKMQAAYAESTT